MSTAGTAGCSIVGTAPNFFAAHDRRCRDILWGDSDKGRDTNYNAVSSSEQTVTVATGLVPSVSVAAASSVTSSSATLNGAVTANGVPVTAVTCEWGTTTGYGSVAPSIQDLRHCQRWGRGWAQRAQCPGWLPATYHFRFNATNTVGTSNSSDLTFTTDAVLPTVSDPTPGNRGLHGRARHGHSQRGRRLHNRDYRVCSGSGHVVHHPDFNIHRINWLASDGQLSNKCGGFMHRFESCDSVRRPDQGRELGGNGVLHNAASFTTTNAPTVTTGVASSVLRTSATVAGTVNANGDNTTVATIKYSDDENVVTGGGGTSATVLPTAAITGSSPTAVSANLTGLVGDTKYFYRVSASNNAGSTDGAVQSFTSGPVEPGPPTG